MKILGFVFICILSSIGYSQENKETVEEFIPIHINEKEAFISTKTGEYVYKEHASTDPKQLVTTKSGVIYTDISIHSITKGESLYTLAKKYEITVDDLKRDNALSSIKLDIGQELKIKKKRVIKSSSPVLSSEPSRIIARLPPNESPASMNPPSDIPTSSNVKPKKESISNSDAIEKQEITAPSYYIVKDGDTLFSIAKQHNISVQELKKLNKLALNNLSVGKKLLLK